MMLIYFIAFLAVVHTILLIILSFYLRYKAYNYIYVEKYNFLEILSIDKYLLFQPIYISLNRLWEIYDQIDEFDDLKYELESYILTIKAYKIIFLSGIITVAIPILILVFIDSLH